MMATIPKESIPAGQGLTSSSSANFSGIPRAHMTAAINASAHLWRIALLISHFLPSMMYVNAQAVLLPLACPLDPFVTVARNHSTGHAGIIRRRGLPPLPPTSSGCCLLCCLPTSI